ncbi:MAG: GDP-mannose 4,6-dehydratase [Patescibacteria group bacterium]|nr:GDP-mannose 4,6-dehydratase [Patescibacteria group bacterium]MCL5224322.1 GDP-mannose 4,6-dehydratase [Patescibacteria group bacterium]
MKILLTGGAGFIGSNILDMYVKQGHEVIVVDNFRSGRIENIYRRLKDKHIQFIFGDILDENFISKLPTDIDVINHHAAQLEITRCIDFPQEDITSNLIGTTNMMEFAKKCPKLKLFIYASSAAVYGQAKSELQSEDDPIDPHWIYGVSKYSTELLAKIYSDQLRIPFIGLRYSIIYGIREWFGRVLTLFIKNSIIRRKIVVFGEGSEVRDYCNVEDVVRLHAILLSKELKPGSHIFNVSSSQKTTISELAHMVAKISGCRVLYEDVKEGKPSKILNDGRIRLPGNLLYLCQDNTKAWRELGWRPKIWIADGVKKEFDWYKKNLKIDRELWSKLFY